MFDDIVADITAHVERTISVRIEELKKLLPDLLIVQTSPLEELCNEMRRLNGKADVISSFVTDLKEPVEDIGLVFARKVNEIRKVEEERRLQELREQEERRKAEESARLGKLKKQEETQKTQDVLRGA